MPWGAVVSDAFARATGNVRRAPSCPMEERFYAEYFEIEDRHWWFLGRRRIILTELARALTPAGPAGRRGRRVGDCWTWAAERARWCASSRGSAMRRGSTPMRRPSPSAPGAA